MRFAVSFLAVVGLASAATQTGAAAPKSTSCDAQNIVDACKQTQQTQIDNCSATDWICLCQNYQNLLTCYNNCPDDTTNRAPVQSQVTAYCAAAAPLISASLADAATRPVPSVASTATLATGTNAANTATGTQAVASAFKTGAAGVSAAPIGGVAAVLLGLAGLL